MDPGPFLRGAAFAGTPKVAYPRAKPSDSLRLPVDTWFQAGIPVCVRLELVGDADVIEIDYRTTTEDLGPRGDGAGRTFSAWRGTEQVDEDKAVLGEGTARLQLGPRTETPVVVYLPEGMKPVVVALRSEAPIEPAPPQPRWIAYGDSVLEGWIASSPALGWGHIASREQSLDVTNMGYAGAARGEIVCAEHIAELDADLISITHGTNCWERIPHSSDQMRANISAFLDVVRQGHPETPILVVSPLLRPDGEATPNRLGATLADLRRAMEEVVRDRIDAGDERLRLVEGGGIIGPEHLGDQVHPNDEGHRAIADAVGPVLKEMAGS
jgi:lysophospholipase L1-like esterase